MNVRRARAFVSLALVLLACPLLPACSGTSKPSASASPSPIRLAMVSDSGSWGERDSAYAGLRAAQERLGAEIAVFTANSPQDYGSRLTESAVEEYDEIFAIGYQPGAGLERIARGFPKTHFAVIDAVVDQPNVTSVIFRVQDGSFLAGALAALVSKGKTVAFLGDVDGPRQEKFEAGYVAGAREANSRVRVLVSYVGSSEDALAGKKAAAQLFERGADVVFVSAGRAGLGAFDEVRSRKGDYLIGSGADQDALVPGKVLTSMLERVDIALFTLAEESLAQKTPSGELSFGLSEGGVGLTDFHYSKSVVGAAKLARVAALERAVIGGRIEPPQTRAQLAAFKPVAF